MSDMQDGHKTAIIVGAGLGGLAAALCLDRIGWRVVVLEQADALADVGAGIQISPNGVKVLRALGLEGAAAALACRPEAGQMRFGKSGRVIFTNPMTDYPSRYGAPYLHLHRADLVSVLAQALSERQPGALRTGAQVVTHQQDTGDVQVTLASGETVSGDVLIGADGLKSDVRAQMLGVAAPRFTGHVAWRMVVPMDRLTTPPPPTACVWVGAGRHAVTYRLRGGELANFVGVVERKDWREESWTAQGTRAEALADFAGWHPAVTGLIEQADTHYQWGLFDRAPLDTWQDGRVALLGDACHPMLPFMAQGAVQALEDAYVLADSMSRHADIPAALAAYERLRHPRTSKVQAAARANAGLFHRRALAGRLATYGPMWLAGKLSPAIIDRRFAWLYGYDVTAMK
ncbi:MAG: FAD-dependent monooxygenase [Parvibaculales bacterium]